MVVRYGWRRVWRTRKTTSLFTKNELDEQLEPHFLWRVWALVVDAIKRLRIVGASAVHFFLFIDRRGNLVERRHADSAIDEHNVHRDQRKELRGGVPLLRGMLVGSNHLATGGQGYRFWVFLSPFG